MIEDRVRDKITNRARHLPGIALSLGRNVLRYDETQLSNGSSGSRVFSNSLSIL